jgi:hypothetical protein
VLIVSENLDTSDSAAAAGARGVGGAPSPLEFVSLMLSGKVCEGERRTLMNPPSPWRVKVPFWKRRTSKLVTKR